MESILTYIQIILGIALTAGILMQQTDASLGAIFGGGNEAGGVGRTRRGMEKILFYATIVLAVLFTLSVLIAFLY